MKRFRQFLAVVIPGLALLLLYVQFTYRQHFTASPTGIRASRDTAVIARGKYLVLGAGHCWTCHVPDATEKRQKGSPGPLSGGLRIDLPVATLYTPNLTPDRRTGIGRYSDEELVRALRYGISPRGEAMLPFMTYHSLSDDDLRAVISYLRSTRPVSRPVPEPDFNLLGKVVKRFVLRPTPPADTPPRSLRPDTSLAYGRYLAHAVANCNGCHTNRSKLTGDFVGEPFAGGYEMETGRALFTTPNLTPDPSTGRLSGWSAAAFVQRFRAGPQLPDSPMPWQAYASLTDTDLKALYYYLQSLQPVANTVQVYQPRP